MRKAWHYPTRLACKSLTPNWTRAEALVLSRRPVSSLQRCRIEIVRVLPPAAAATKSTSSRPYHPAAFRTQGFSSAGDASLTHADEPWREHRALKWNELSFSARDSWTTLGWTQASWDFKQAVFSHDQTLPAFSHDKTPWEYQKPPVSCQKSWANLDTKEQLAASSLGFTSASWDEASLELQKPSLGGLFAGWDMGLIIGGIIVVVGFHAMTDTGQTRQEMNKQDDQVEAVHMQRVRVSARPNWQQRCEDVGFSFHSADGIRWGTSWTGSVDQDPYWCENGVYIFSQESAVHIQEATWELHNLCLLAVDRVVNDQTLMDLFEVPASMQEAVRISWRNRQPDLVGRFDLMYDGHEPAKLLEYNADTPTVLIESSLAQSSWMQDRKSSAWQLQHSDGVAEPMDHYTQFNAIDEALVESWQPFLKRSARAAGASPPDQMIIASQRAAVEERCTADYLADSCRRAGISAASVDLHDLEVDESGKLSLKEARSWSSHQAERKKNKEARSIDAIWKLYPWEWLADEDLGHAAEANIASGGTIWAEPAWKTIMANKAILALLWEMFPGHPNLLPAFFSVSDAEKYEQEQAQARKDNSKDWTWFGTESGTSSNDWGWVAKPKFGREGIGIRYSFDASSLTDFYRRAQDDLSQLESTKTSYNPGMMWQIEKLGRQLLGQYDGNFGKSQLMSDRGELEANMAAELPFPPLGDAVLQLYQDVDTFSGRRPVLGSWIVFGSPAGMCVREDIQRTTDNDSCFTPHLVDLSMSAPLHVEHLRWHSAERAVVNHSGKYVLRGQLRGGGVYYCAENQLYLLRNAEKRWMFSFHEGGGPDGLTGTAFCEHPCVRPTSLSSETWFFLDKVGDFNPIKLDKPVLSIMTYASEISHAKAEMLATKKQQSLRTELYGSSGGKLDENHETDRSSHHGSHGGGRLFWNHPSSSGGYHGGYHSGYPRGDSGQQSSKEQEQKRQQQNQERHGRKSAGKAWKSYGTGQTTSTASSMGGVRQPTGTYGKSMGYAGSSGRGGS